MLYIEVIAVCSEIHTQDIIALGGKEEEFLTVKPDGTQSNWWALSG
jgi:hypothetical protein